MIAVKGSTNIAMELRNVMDMTNNLAQLTVFTNIRNHFSGPGFLILNIFTIMYSPHQLVHAQTQAVAHRRSI